MISCSYRAKMARNFLPQAKKLAPFLFRDGEEGPIITSITVTTVANAAITTVPVKASASSLSGKAGCVSVTV